MLNMTRVLLFGQITGNLFIRETAAEPGEVPRQERKDNEQAGDNYQPKITWAFWRSDGRGSLGILAVWIYEFFIHLSLTSVRRERSRSHEAALPNQIPRGPLAVKFETLSVLFPEELFFAENLKMDSHGGHQSEDQKEPRAVNQENPNEV